MTLQIHGHAIEARLYAEDPETRLSAVDRQLYAWRSPEGEAIRVDSRRARGR